jgi:hypothetical protein
VLLSVDRQLQRLFDLIQGFLRRARYDRLLHSPFPLELATDYADLNP